VGPDSAETLKTEFIRGIALPSVGPSLFGETVRMRIDPTDEDSTEDFGTAGLIFPMDIVGLLDRLFGNYTGKNPNGTTRGH
jgi:hypothetical protein